MVRRLRPATIVPERSGLLDYRGCLRGCLGIWYEMFSWRPHPLVTVPLDSRTVCKWSIGPLSAMEALCLATSFCSLYCNTNHRSRRCIVTHVERRTGPKGIGK